VTSRAAILALLALALLPAVARADGDPASDVLLQQDVFLPYSVPTSQGTANALTEVTKRTAKAGWPIKVAIIAGGNDLGSAAQYASDPQGYANFLASELQGGVGGSGSNKLRLLIVTPVGFGGQNLGDNVDKALSGLSADKPDGDVLGKVAVLAIGRLAAADGHRVAVPAIDLSGANGRPYRSDVSLHTGQPANVRRGPGKSSGGGGGGGGAVFAVVGILAVLGLGIGAVALRQRRRVPEP
jgi:hypothetical protein